MQESAFTFEFEKGKSPFIPVRILNGAKPANALALWDTGATISCISKNAVKVLGITDLQDAMMVSASETVKTKSCHVSILFPGTVYFKNVKVLVLPEDPIDHDVIIGMDIIKNGDFAITNYGTKSVLTFRAPSKETIDFTE